MLLTPVYIIPSVGTKIYRGRSIKVFNIHLLLEIHHYFQNHKSSLIKWQITTINIVNRRQQAQRWTVEMQNWTALYCPEISEAARCRKVLFVLNIGDSEERQCDCWWLYKCITVVNNLYVHQMILQSSTPPVTVCTHMMTANSTWCLRTISCIFYQRTWQSKCGICSTETKCWVSWKVVYFKIRPHQLVYTDNVSVCFRQWNEQWYQRKFPYTDGWNWKTIVRPLRSDNTQDIQPRCNYSAIQGHI